MNTRTAYVEPTACRSAPAGRRRVFFGLGHTVTTIGSRTTNARCSRRGVVFLSLIFCLASMPCSRGFAQTDLVIYSDALAAGWMNYPMATVDYSNSSPTYAGSKSISVNAKSGEGIVFYRAGFDTVSYSDLSFRIHGGTQGGQLLHIMAILNGQPRPPVEIEPLASGEWQHVTVSLAALGVANEANVNGFGILDRSDKDQPPYYLDEIRLIAVPPPVLPEIAYVRVDATQEIRTVDPRLFGVNAAIWDADFDTPATVTLLQAMDNQALRFPGGSLSDEYHWASNTTGKNTWNWATSFDRFARVAITTSAHVFITVNYGTGTAREAADWVRYSNVTKTYGFTYWEIGNESYGSWETDAQVRPHDPYTYATRAKDYYEQMKAVDPSIRVGVVVCPGEDTSFVVYADHAVVNPRTGTTHYGWTPVVLSTLQSLGVTPDFVIHHRYAQQPGAESDFRLLQSTRTWTNESQDLRQQLVDYLGPTNTSVELVCTEHNSVSSRCGKQTTSLVNALFLADSLGQALQTEFNAVLWWDLRNGREASNNNDATLYGWRNYGDYGMVSGPTHGYPTFFVSKLLTHFARGGDQLVKATSDCVLLSAYAARRTNGCLTLLFVNKSPSEEAKVEVQLSGYEPRATATVYSYGVPQDEAARTGRGSVDVSETYVGTAGANFTCTFGPYSVNVVVLEPVTELDRLFATG